MSSNEQILKEVNRRKTFAIISHPDAGKTTLTEKLLLYGGAIRLAGAVKGRKAAKHAVSDWMEIEKQRGISVTSSAMQFDYQGYRINILDTPGHQDFSEDTYRTLMAADSAVMLIDGAKGVEEQTLKLFHVCKMRGIPIFTFINKLDRYCKNPFELIEEIEKTLGIQSYPMNWPIGTEGNFKGVYNRELKQIELFNNQQDHGQAVIATTTLSVDNEQLVELLGADLCAQLCEDIELLNIAGDRFDLEKVKAGELTPIFFGSAMTNFGVEPFLEKFILLAPSPAERKTNQGMKSPHEDRFSGFVFKIQANMDPAHRDRIAFIRICSGKFERGLEVNNVRIGKTIKLAQPQQFFAQERSIIEEAYAGDIIGVYDPGVFNIGDTLCDINESFRFEGIPIFPPEHFALVTTKDAMKRKQFLKGIAQIAEEGAIQVFKKPNIGIEALTIGVVGVLQFEVLEYRMKNEYGVDINLQRLPYCYARWVMPENVAKDLVGYSGSIDLVEDQYNRPVLLFKDQWSLNRAIDNNKGAKLYDVAPTNLI
ncbi:MAG TPA: peptide chain release factor 3 [Bacillota bacterium]|nr:peptide chain release factor 3 [Bacillota bacterium]HOL08662.1 peptide chain release factor 3 [Bacillota bacterium]HPO96636.1 peptide chain release factor 3 [Bacillota bacterium]